MEALTTSIRCYNSIHPEDNKWICEININLGEGLIGVYGSGKTAKKAFKRACKEAERVIAERMDAEVE